MKNFNKFKIRNFLLIFFLNLLFLQSVSFAQLSGIKSIPGDYATIEAAINALDTLGVGLGGVTFNVASGHTETFTSDSSGKISATGTLSNPIVFQKSGGGVNPKITAAVGTGTRDGIIIIKGGDYITFDGIDVAENPLNINTVTRMEWGYAILKKNTLAPANGSWYVIIKNATITLEKTHTATRGIYTANHTDTSTTSSAMSDALDAMSNCKFFNNIISNVNWGIHMNGSSLAAFYDQSNEIGVGGGNNISNYGGVTVASYGIEVQYQNNIKIANNIVNGGVAGHTGAIYGIRTGSGLNSNIDIYSNTVTLTQGGSSIMYGIVNSMGSSGAGNSVNIYNNIVENCLHPVSTSNTVWLIYNLAGCSFLNIYGNTVRNNTKSAGTGTMYCIYNTPPSIPDKVEIYDNEIYNNTSAGPIHGILSDDGLIVNIYKNEIYDLTSSSASTTALATAGITIPAGGDTVSVNIYNNFISDLKAPGSGFNSGLRAINITSTSVISTIGLYYNTIFLNQISGGTNFGSAGVYHTNSTTATTAALDMRNNIIVNLSSSSGTGKTVILRRSAVNANLNNYSTLSNNNSFYAGMPGASNVIFWDGTNFDQTIEEFKVRIAPRESFSFSENVPFVNGATAPFNLHISTGIATQTESGGSPLTSPPTVITTDIDGNTRNTVKADVGADEFNGIAADLTAPAINYTLLSHTQSTANRSLTGVNVIDWNDVNVTAGTRPRIYYKRASDNNTYVDNTSSSNGWKYTETSSSASPFEFLIDYSLLFGAGVQNGDTVQYFVVAQDLFSTPNVGINIGVFASTPSSVNLTPAAFPISGTINFYRIIIQLNGIVTVGTGGNYPSLTGSNGLFTAINENIVSGNLNVEVVSNLTETGTIALNQWVEDGSGNYTITIKPSSNVVRTISGSFAGGLLTLNGTDRVTIDGRFNGSGRYLTIENTNSASNTAAIRLISLGAGLGCSDITIRNSNIKAATGTLANTFGIFVGSGTGTVSTGNAGGADFDNISILENHISRCRVGLFARGTSTDQMQNYVVSGNIIGSDNSTEYVTEYGSYIGYADAPQVTFNEVYNMIFDVSKWGIYFTQNVNNARISFNKVHSIKQPGTTGFNSVGIVFFSATNCFDNQIDNNMIYDLSTYGNTSMFLVGIRLAGSGYKVYYNSVSITDTIGNPAINLVSSCLYFSAASANADVRNNIFLNTRTGNTPKNYTVHSPNTTTFTNLDHNNYWNTGSVFGFWGADVANFNIWKATVGQDLNSLNIDPMFTNTLNLHINSGLTPIQLESGGTEITGLVTDIDGDDRPGPAGSVNGGATDPDIGADEFDGVPYVEPDTVHVSIFNNFFDPADFTISVGDYVTWTLMEGHHTTTSNIIPSGAAPWNQMLMNVGEKFTYQVTLSGDYNYECLLHPGMNGSFTAVGSASTFQLTADVQDKWNIVSVPGLHPTDQNVNTWWAFRDMTANVFQWSNPAPPPPNGYVSVTDVTPGLGYWMKHLGARTYNTGDEYPASGILIVPHDPISVFQGWNLFGGYDDVVPVTSLTSTPPGLIIAIFQYNSTTPPTGYSNPDNLEPGRGYWVNINPPGGVINIPDVLAKDGNSEFSPLSYKENWGRIIITDASGKSYTLYAVKGAVDLNLYELPPAPPAGMFDMRFSSGRVAEDIASSIQTIEMSGIEHPVTVRVENMDIRLTDESGKALNEFIKSGEEVVVRDAAISKLKVTAELKPVSYALEQNYPNPFNPSTVIEFSLPEDVNNVKLTIYNALGERMAELVNGNLTAGKYQYQWNAGSVATGMYIYELRTDKFVSVKKMVLLK